MDISHTDIENIKCALEKLPGVESATEIEIENRLIEHISIEHKSTGRIIIHRLNVEDALALFDFYFQGLSGKSREFFPPYPLFNPPPNSVEELSTRIIDWKKEDDWTFLTLNKDEQIIGVCLLKKYKREQPTSGLAVREEFQKRGLGFLLQTIVNKQACLLGIKKFCVTVAPENVASLQVHKKCGFRQTGKLVPHLGYKDGVKVIDRYDVEMVVGFDCDN